MRYILLVILWLGLVSQGNAATISWTDTSSGSRQEDSFILEKGPSSTGPFSQFATAVQNTTSKVFTPGAAGSTEWYRIKAVNSIGSSPYSAVVSYTVPTPPPLGVPSVSCAYAPDVISAAPQFMQSVQTAWNSATSPKTTASITVQTGDVLIASAIIESYGGGAGTPSISIAGGGLSWGSPLQTIQTTDYTAVKVWAATATANTSLAVTFTNSQTGMWFGGVVVVFRNSAGVGTSAKTNVASGAPSLNITTTQANSAVVVVNGDWAAVDGTARVWRTVNSLAPTAANGYERTYFRDANKYTVYLAYYPDVGAGGAKTVGLTTPASQKYSLIAVEVKGMQ